MSYAVKNDSSGQRAITDESEVGADEYFSLVPVTLTPAVTTGDVDAERDRRIDSGVLFNGVRYQTRPDDRENIAGSAQLAFMAIVGGAEPANLRWASDAEDFAWIAEDNTLHVMDAQTMVDFGKAAASRKNALIFDARDLKNMAPIPVDYTADKWWS